MQFVFAFEPRRQQEQMSPAETELQPWFLVNISLINFTECNHFFFYDKSIFTPCRASGRLMLACEQALGRAGN